MRPADYQPLHNQSRNPVTDLSIFDIPQSCIFQGTVTTDQDFKILSANNEFLYTFHINEGEVRGLNLGHHFIDDGEFEKVVEKLKHDPDESWENESPILVEMIVTLQRKKNEAFKAICRVIRILRDGSTALMWTFNEIQVLKSNLCFNGTTSHLIDQGRLFGINGTLTTTELIPRFNGEGNYCGMDTSGIKFPLVATTMNSTEISNMTKHIKNIDPRICQGNWYTLSAMPNVAGMIIISSSGNIESINDPFAKHLFGKSEKQLLGKPIVDLIPQFYACLASMKSAKIKPEILVEEQLTLIDAKHPDPIYIRHNRHSKYDKTNQDSCTSGSCSVQAIHSDGTRLPVLLQQPTMKLDPQYRSYFAAWICFHREYPPLNAEEVDSSVQSLDTITSKLAINRDHYKFPEKLLQFEEPLTTDDFEIISDLGHGAFGTVHVGTYSLDPDKVKLAKKVLRWTKSDSMLPMEIAILQKIRGQSNHLPEMKLFFADEYNYYILREYYPSIDLFEYNERNPPLPEVTVKHIIKQVLQAVNYLHSLGIVHRDIKVFATNTEENAIITYTGHVILIDLGAAAFISEGPFVAYFGTIGYAAPEILSGIPYQGIPQDVWQLGILLYVLLFRENPFDTTRSIFTADPLQNATRNISVESRSFIIALLDRSPETRISIQNALSHPWFSV